MSDESPGRHGDNSLAAGVTALACTFVPGVGEFLAVPAAVLAIALGLIGVRRHETGRAPRVAAAATGVMLGVLALLAVLVVVLAVR